MHAFSPLRWSQVQQPGNIRGSWAWLKFNKYVITSLPLSQVSVLTTFSHLERHKYWQATQAANLAGRCEWDQSSQCYTWPFESLVCKKSVIFKIKLIWSHILSLESGFNNLTLPSDLKDLFVFPDAEIYSVLYVWEYTENV